MNVDLKLPMELQAVIAVLIVQLVHKIVREIPGSIKMGTVGLIFTIVFAGILIAGIILNLLKNRLGLVLGIICAASIIFQEFECGYLTDKR